MGARETPLSANLGVYGKPVCALQTLKRNIGLSAPFRCKSNYSFIYSFRAYVADFIDFSVVFSMLNRKADAEGASRRAAHGTARGYGTATLGQPEYPRSTHPAFLRPRPARYSVE